MFDRVKICPHCGSTGAKWISSPDCALDGFGGLIQANCLDCYSPLLSVTCSWELSHRLLRRTMIVCRNSNGRFRPNLWKPLPLFQDLGFNARSALRRMVSEVWTDFIPSPSTSGECRWKVAALREIQILSEFVSETAGITNVPVMSVQDYLSWCHFRGHFHCFG